MQEISKDKLLPRHNCWVDEYIQWIQYVDWESIIEWNEDTSKRSSYKSYGREFPGWLVYASIVKE